MKSFAVALLAACLVAPACFAKEETFTFAPFGTVTVYLPSPHPAHVALFLSGDGGWKLGVIDMAREIAGMDTLVAGVSLPFYMKSVGAVGHETAAADPSVCFDPGGELAALGRAVEERYGYTTHVPPILIGYSSGATLVYAALVQAPPRTFGGAVSLGFCPDLIVNMPICKGSGLAWKHDKDGKGVDFLPSKGLEVPWVALQGDIDQVCTPEDTRTYVGEVPHGELVWLHKVGHGFSVPKNWMRQFKESFERIATGERPDRDAKGAAEPAGSQAAPAPPASPESPPPPQRPQRPQPAPSPQPEPQPTGAVDASSPSAHGPTHRAPDRLSSLPLTEVRARHGSGGSGGSSGSSGSGRSARGSAGRRMAVLLTGDGGWRASDRRLAEALAARGVPVVGWSSLRYFLRGRSPDEGARDLDALLRHYLAAWRADEAIVIGYSFGADVAPFFINRLPTDLRARIPLVALVGPDRRADFRLTLTDLAGRDGKASRAVLPEIEKLRGKPILCSYGEQEKGSLCAELDRDLAHAVRRPGGHRLAGGGRIVAGHILKALDQVDSARRSR